MDLKTVGDWFLNPLVARILIVLAGLVVLRMVLKFMHRKLEGPSRPPELRYRLHRLIKASGYLAAAALLIGVFSKYLEHWTVALGVVGAGVAVALQEVITSIAGWVAISFGGFFTLGDRVQLGGITGDVIDIGILRTTVMELGQWVKGDQYNGRIVRIANSFIFKEPVYNYSGDFPFVWDEVMVPIHYGNDAELAREIMLRVADEVVGEYVPLAEQRWQAMTRKFMIDNAMVKPMVLMAVTDNYMEFTLRYVVEYKIRRLVKSKVTSRLLEEIDKTAGKVTISSSTSEVTVIQQQQPPQP
ncbi:MAG TPA: mechanosensitive ion channel domain-containing protein [Geomonas sp.]|nr:mechanosensitive ion channel domain-containing protein [Geomonas sp.]